MQGCTNGLCGKMKECLLEEYFTDRRTNTDLERSEVAHAFDGPMGKNCINKEDLVRKYRRILSVSRKAARRLDRNP